MEIYRLTARFALQGSKCSTKRTEFKAAAFKAARLELFQARRFVTIATQPAKFAFQKSTAALAQIIYGFIITNV